MKSYKYKIVIYRSEADHAFIAEVPELAECKSDGGPENFF